MGVSRRRQSGLALITVLWVLILLAVMAGSFTLTVTREIDAARNNLDLAQGRQIAMGAVRYGLAMLAHPRQKQRWRPDGRWHRVTIDDTQVRVRVATVSGRVDLNMGSPELIKGLLRQAGVKSEKQRKRLLANIQDWRDPDDATSPGGTGEGAYPSGQPGPANRPFMAVPELQRVLGITPAIYRQLAPSVTVYSRSEQIIPLWATRTVLLAVPGAKPKMVDNYLKRRRKAFRSAKPAPKFPLGGGFFEQFGTVAYAVDTWVQVPGEPPVGWSVEAARQPNRGKPFVFLSVRELDARDRSALGLKRDDSRE